MPVAFGLSLSHWCCFCKAVLFRVLLCGIVEYCLWCVEVCFLFGWRREVGLYEASMLLALLRKNMMSTSFHMRGTMLMLRASVHSCVRSTKSPRCFKWVMSISPGLVGLLILMCLTCVCFVYFVWIVVACLRLSGLSYMIVVRVGVVLSFGTRILAPIFTWVGIAYTCDRSGLSQLHPLNWHKLQWNISSRFHSNILKKCY